MLSEPAIVARLAKATLGANSSVPWDDLVADYDRIRERIERVIPGFREVQRTGPRAGRVLPAERTATGHVSDCNRQGPLHCALAARRLPSKPGQLVMMTIRTHDQFNTTVYGLDDRYRGIQGERRVVLMNTDDLKERGLAAGEVVDLVGHFRGQTRRAERFLVVAYDIPRGCCATYFPETNVLVPIDSTADGEQHADVEIRGGDGREESKPYSTRNARMTSASCRGWVYCG